MASAKTTKVDYGNWVSKKFIYVPGLIALAFVGLSFLSLWFLIGVGLFFIPTAYFMYAFFQFSPKGGNLQAKVRNLAMEQLIWSGKGKLLDIGCGNGAMAIEAAQRYPAAQVTGIDYWGGQWEYSKASCEKNAGIAGVADRTVFQKASAAKLPFADGAFDVSLSNFVFHEVQDTKDKREVVKEALRVLKKGGTFVFQDLFLVKKIYGEPDDLVAVIKSWGIDEVNLQNTSDKPFIPGPMKLPFMIGEIGIIYGRK